MSMISDPIQLLEHAESLALLREALDDLPALSAQVLKLYFGLDGRPLTQSQIADLLEMSRGAAGQALHVGLHYLRRNRKLLRDTGLTLKDLSDRSSRYHPNRIPFPREAVSGRYTR